MIVMHANDRGHRSRGTPQAQRKVAENGMIGQNNVYQNNLTYGNGSNWSLKNGQKGVGTITADPLMADPANGDYSLSANSPAIDKGIANGAPTFDIDGVQRPHGGAHDIGAYEWHI